MFHPFAVWAVIGAILALAPPTALAQQGSDDLWEVTAKMEMAGMPFAMPPQTSRVCVQKGKQTEAMAPQDKNCRMQDLRQSGNRTTFQVVCEGKDRMTGTADFTHAVDSYQGIMRFQGVMDGRQVDMTQNLAGRKVGACTWQDPGIKVKQALQQQSDQKAAMCRDLMSKLEMGAFTGQAAICKEYHGEFLDRVREVAGEMRRPAGFDHWVRTQRSIQQVLQYGGHDPNAIWGAACSEGVTTRNWTFVANYCEAQARQVAMQQCTGRDPTTIQTFEYAPICMRYPPQRGQAKQGDPAAGPPPRQATPGATPPQAQPVPGVPVQPAPAASATPPAPSQQEPGISDKALEGLNKLKGLFGR